MSILSQIKKDQLSARKLKDSRLIGLLTVLISDIHIVGKNDGNRETTEDEAFSVIKKTIKIIEINLGLNFPAETKNELLKNKETLLSYLPKQASEEELLLFINKHKEKSKGEIFKLLKEVYNNNFDSKLANQLISKNITTF